jgi:hypothetical protein
MYRGFSIAISTVLLRNMLFMLSIYGRKQFYVRSYIEISAALFFCYNLYQSWDKFYILRLACSGPQDCLPTVL